MFCSQTGQKREKWRKNKNNEGLKNQYKKAETKFKNITVEARTKHWEHFGNSLNGKTNLTEAWKKIKSIQGSTYQEIPILGVSNITDSEHVNTLARQFQTASSNSNITPEFEQKKSKCENIRKIENRDADPDAGPLNSLFSEIE